MTIYRVKNGSHVDKAFKVYGGHKIVPAGKADEVETVEPLSEEMLSSLERDGVKVTESKAETAAASAGPKAEHRGGGRYFIMDGDQTVGEAMTKEDAEAFNALSDEDKAAFLQKD